MEPNRKRRICGGMSKVGETPHPTTTSRGALSWFWYPAATCGLPLPESALIPFPAYMDLFPPLPAASSGGRCFFGAGVGSMVKESPAGAGLGEVRQFWLGKREEDRTAGAFCSVRVSLCDNSGIEAAGTMAELGNATGASPWC